MSYAVSRRAYLDREVDVRALSLGAARLVVLVLAGGLVAVAAPGRAPGLAAALALLALRRVALGTRYTVNTLLDLLHKICK